MPAAIPSRAFWVMISAVVELIDATLDVTNKYLFLILVTVTVHGVGVVTAPNSQMQGIQASFFLKGVAMTGAALLITQLGARRSERS
jgi:hypothetical protein